MNKLIAAPQGRHMYLDIDQCKISNDPQYDAIADHLFHMIRKCTLGTPSAGKRKDKFITLIKVILCNLHNAYSVHPEMYIRFERGGNAYKQNKKYKGFQFGRDNVVKVTDFLHENGFIKLIIGSPATDDTPGERSLMRATGKLIDLLEKHFNANPATIYRDTQYLETIILKGKKKRPPKKEWDDPDNPPKPKRYIISTPEGKYVEDLRSNVRLINKAIQNCTIELDIPADELVALNLRLAASQNKYARPIDFTAIHLYRVFLVNKALNLHGRFYGAWWQGVSEEIRDRIVINGMPTVELDYKSIHPYILYGLEGVEPALTDQYYLSGESKETNEKLRPLIKKFLLIMLNSHSVEEAIGALNKKYREEKKRSEGLGKPISEPPFELTEENLFPVIEKLKRQHAPIAHHFFSGCGNKLMYYDSQMAEEVMLNFAKDGIPCLPIHDSFIVDVRYKDRCYDAMRSAYQSRFNQDIPIDVAMYGTKIADGSCVVEMSEKWQELQTHAIIGGDIDEIQEPY